MRPIVVAIVLAGSVAVLPPADAREAASRIVDRTFSCEAGFVGGLHQVGLMSTYSASPGSPTLRASSSVTRNIYESLGHLSSDGVTVDRRRCAVARRTVKLTTTGMRGGVVPPLGAEATCETPRRVLLRLHAVFQRPVMPRTVRTFEYPQFTAMGELERAALAVGTLAGNTIAYASVTGTEQARLFTLRTCEED